MNTLVCVHFPSHPPPGNPRQTPHPAPQGLLPVEIRFVILTYLAEWQYSRQTNKITFTE
jgi:cytochrome oxidase assembly protein ShyY1